VSIVATLSTTTALGGTAGARLIDVVPLPPTLTVELERTNPEPVPDVVPSTVVTPSTVPDPTPEEIAVARSLTDALATPGVVAFSVAGSLMVDPPASRDNCIAHAKARPIEVDGAYDRNLIAQMTHDVFECLAAAEGLDERAPTALRRWNGAAIWGFGSLAHQVAAESVVVAYCESEGFDPRALTRSNGFGYGGLFQMGSTEMRRFGEAGADRFDPIDNAIAAANYFLFQYHNGAGWGGWRSWTGHGAHFDRVGCAGERGESVGRPDHDQRGGIELHG